MGFLHQGNLSEVQFGVVKEGRKRPQWKDQYSVQVRLCEISWTTTNTQTWPAIDKWQWGFYFGQVYCLSTDVWTAGVLIESPLICGKFYNLVFSCPDPSASNAMSESVFSLWHRVYLKNFTPPCPCSDFSALYFDVFLKMSTLVCTLATGTCSSKAGENTRGNAPWYDGEVTLTPVPSLPGRHLGPKHELLGGLLSKPDCKNLKVFQGVGCKHQVSDNPVHTLKLVETSQGSTSGIFSTAS